MVRPDVAGIRVARAETWLTDASRYFDMPPAEFVASSKERDLALFYLFLAIQKCIDVAAHWVADEGWQPADDAGSTFDVLAARGVIEAADAAALRAAAGLRIALRMGTRCLTTKGRALLLIVEQPKTKWDVLLLPISEPSAPRPLLTMPFNERTPTLSPNGAWIRLCFGRVGPRRGLRTTLSVIGR